MCYVIQATYFVATDLLLIDLELGGENAGTEMDQTNFMRSVKRLFNSKFIYSILKNI